MKKELIENNVILKLSIDFSILVIDYCGLLNKPFQYIITKQLIRSATSIGANAMEAQNSESKADFIHKMKIAAKEAEETQYWLILCERSNNFPDCLNLQNKLEAIQKIMSAILGTIKRNII